uniref:Meiotic recombination protein REC114-like isoform X2 n=1 Tax=Crassostrea virginica TaxID=6565 RepID=A0A8B8D639_CRAVI|nr:meiotic recombination protein REC114-like isoform X2 [Crassostrea virginica]
MVWKIQRYARQKAVHKGGDSIEWEDYDGKDFPLELRIHQGNLTLTQAKTIRECYNLPASASTLRAVSKGDTLLVIYRLRTNTHRFRVKFAGGENSCQECAEQMSEFFPVKILPTSIDPCQNEDNKSRQEKPVLEGEVTLSKMAEVVCGTATERLWTSYDGSQSMKGIQLNSLVKLCLGDPSFPAFVEEVEKELNKIIKEQGKTPDSHQD